MKAVQNCAFCKLLLRIDTMQKWPTRNTVLVLTKMVSFLARDSMLSTLYAIANPSVRLSVCPSHGWISGKRLKLGTCNFHHTVAPSLCILQYKFHPEILNGIPRAGASNKGVLGKTSYLRSFNAFARWLQVIGKMRNCGMRNAESKMRNRKMWKWMRNGG